MIVVFPDFDTLQLVITSATVPPAISLSAVEAGTDDQGRCWLRPSAPLPSNVCDDLVRLGVQIEDTAGGGGEALGSWPQALPLQRVAKDEPVSGQTVVLFEMPDSKVFPTLVGEMLRLGNDRQSFRYLDDDDGKRRILLRVVGPPYYSLLRAVDRESATRPRAYVERAPNVWVEIGHTHPLLEQIHPESGKLLLMRPPRQWSFLDNAPFRDIYEVLDFQLPDHVAKLRDTPLPHRLQVPLRLAAGGSGEAAELWVVRDRPIEQLDALVQNADDPLLQRLAFAVGQHQGQTTVVVRVRPSKLPPPVVVLDGQAFRAFLKLPNLFVPCGWQLQPPLRRDAVRRLLAAEVEQITWLYPLADGAFRPESLPDDSFRPLADWVDYVLDHDQEALRTWVEATQFDFEPFICKDEAAPQPKPPPTPAPREPQNPTSDAREPEPPDAARARLAQSPPPQSPRPRADLAPRRELPSVLQERLCALEKQFLHYTGADAIAQRQALWPELAALNAALEQHHDAGLCWLNALWQADPPPPDWLRRWVQAETQHAPEDLQETYLDKILILKQPAVPEVRSLAAWCVWWGTQPTPPPWLHARLEKVQAFLRAHEDKLPARAAWLAWVHVLRLASGDVLGLARARDRLLNRLLDDGLKVDLDLPSFLRFSGQDASQRLRVVRERLLQLRESAQRWLRRAGYFQVDPRHPPQTPIYADLIFAFGLARLNDVSVCRQLLRQAEEELGQRDEVHSFLLQAYYHRIHDALAGKPHAGPLLPEQLEYLETLERQPRYVVDRLRQRSRILDPQERFDPYRLWKKFGDDLNQRLVRLPDVIDVAELRGRCEALLARYGTARTAVPTRLRLLAGLAPVAHRLGEAFTVDVLQRSAQTLDALEPTPDPALTRDQLAPLLERCLFLAAHFDQREHVQQFLRHFVALFERHGLNADATDLHGTLLQCLRGLRRLGWRDEVARILEQLAAYLLREEDLAVTRARLGRKWPAALRALLLIASGWSYFGQSQRAAPIIQAARDLLFCGELGHQDKTPLTCAYVMCVGTMETAFDGMEELFEQLGRLVDPFTVNSHYSVSQLDVIETVVLTVVSEDFALGSGAKRWLDEDEYLIRRRIHDDVRSVLARTT
ncbi:MAG: hypothetical protein ACK4RK_14480 [Gemmataceae bacterium]